jgi:hypothetical protein
VSPKGGTILGAGIRCGTLGAACTVDHPDGTSVVLTAIADEGFALVSFTGDCTSGGQITMTGAAPSCSASFMSRPTVVTATEVVAGKQAIEALLVQYCTAVSQLDIGAVRRVFPTVSGNLEPAFAQYRALQCSTGRPTYLQLDVAEGRAAIDVDVTQTILFKNGGSPRSVSTAATITLSRPERSGAWRIDSMLHQSQIDGR